MAQEIITSETIAQMKAENVVRREQGRIATLAIIALLASLAVTSGIFLASATIIAPIFFGIVTVGLAVAGSKVATHPYFK